MQCPFRFFVSPRLELMWGTRAPLATDIKFCYDAQGVRMRTAFEYGLFIGWARHGADIGYPSTCSCLQSMHNKRRESDRRDD